MEIKGRQLTPPWKYNSFINLGLPAMDQTFDKGDERLQKNENQKIKF